MLNDPTSPKPSIPPPLAESDDIADLMNEDGSIKEPASCEDDE